MHIYRTVFHADIQTSKSPFDIEKHRARVASIQKSPEGFAFSKRDMQLVSSDSTIQVWTSLFLLPTTKCF